MKNSNPNPCWERIDKLMWYYRFRTVIDFADFLELKHPDNLYQIKRGCNGISIVMTKKICEKLPHVNKCWLLFGEGEMLKKEAVETDPDPTLSWRLRR